MVDAVLAGVPKSDPDSFIHVEMTEDEPSQITAITVITGDMKQNFVHSPLLVFLNCTYKINVENYCMYGMVGQDRHEKGGPAAFGYLSSE